MRQCAQKGCTREAQPGMFSCATCVPLNPLTLPTEEEKKGEFWIELAPPFTDKLSKLKEFIDEHDLLGGLDKKFLRQVLANIENRKLHVTQFKAGIKKVDSDQTTQVWTTSFTVNNKKEFKGEAADFADAFLAMAEDFESFIYTATLN